ncbi:phytoene/squalene synthase family protein [Lysobacter sp. S4-A87]|uniref:phytoene/squalene synthase family protein n=1 Tax=Lysobacter sp. S4-A87 TaxID=2925843 RepID=UPI001F53A366|nr:phytoene/squalene synthase family protein [Lysobacter sp. S4-A87]UNK50330.1 phytoene/squalene synthase family protein [Lysobacter sp. S4-A87]
MSEPLPVAVADGGSSDALDSFLDKFRARWPEWAVVQVFVPQAQRDIALAWATLLQELTDAAWGGSDARPGEAKLAWWSEELHGWSQGARRHPLGIALQKLPAPWKTLAAALPALRESRERPRDLEDAYASLQTFAQAAARIEAVLFGGADVPDATAAATELADPAERLVTAGLLYSRLAHVGESAAPLATLARTEGLSVAHAWAAELLRTWPTASAATRPRRLWSALARQRLRRGDATLPLPPWSALLTGWRGARGN